MKKFIRIIILLLLILLGVISIRLVFGGRDKSAFFPLLYIPFIFLILFTITSLFLDFSFFKIDKNVFQFTVSFVGLVFCGITIFKYVQYSIIDHSQTILQVSYLPGAQNMMIFKFKTGNRFRLTELWIWGQTDFYGKYQLQNDTILLLESNFEEQGTELPRMGVIFGDTVYWKGFERMVIDKEDSNSR